MDTFFERLGEKAPEAVGTRIELVSMYDDHDPIPSGTRGTVRGGNGSQLWVDWDNGRNLSLIVGEDRYVVIA